MALSGQLPLAVFARIQQIALTVVDCGVAENIAAHERLLMRKIAHGTRNTRAALAMTLEQAHAGMRAGMDIVYVYAAHDLSLDILAPCVASYAHTGEEPPRPAS